MRVINQQAESRGSDTGDQIFGDRTRLRPVAESDVATLVRIRSTPEVRHRWRGVDIEAEVRGALTDEKLHVLVIESIDSEIMGAIQWAACDDPDYSHASIDIFLDPAFYGQGLGTDAVRALCRFLVSGGGFHRLVIDPASDNLAAIRCYGKVGFRPVGIMRRYERGVDGSFHDGLLMDLLAEEFTDTDFTSG
jgi:aminoglycoside 6'-N-acetyltransferase